MKALKYIGPGKLQIKEEPVPSPKNGEVLLKIHACGICGSDVEGYLGKNGQTDSPDDHGTRVFSRSY